jgi:hypothetical protein
MEAILNAVTRRKGLTIVVALLVMVGVIYARILGMSPDQQEDLLYAVQDYLPITMFGTLAILLFSGFPVAFILGGLSFLFGILGYFLDMFSLIEFFNFMPRIWFQAAENLVLVSIPAFVFMGVMMERSGVANDLLYCVQVLLKRVAGSLALAVIIMGTVLAAMTGIIGLRLYRGFGNFGHPHSAQHHADYHGRPDGCVGRQHVHGRNRPRTGPCLFLSGLCGDLRQTQAGGRPTVATGITPCAKG